jgi:cephalosporin-C deacetylase
MDPVCPPSTVFAAYNHYGGPADIDVWKFNGHEGGGQAQRTIQLRWLAEVLAGHA